MKNTRKTLIALFMVFVMVFTMIPGSALASDKPEPNGDGTEESGGISGMFNGLLNIVLEIGDYLKGEDTDFVDDLFKEGGLLYKLLPEGTDLNAMTQMVREQLSEDGELAKMVRDANRDPDKFVADLMKSMSDRNSGVFQLIASFRNDMEVYAKQMKEQLSDEKSGFYAVVSDAITNSINEDGSLNTQQLGILVNVLVGGYNGNNEYVESSDFYYPGDEVYEASRAAYAEINQESMDEADVQIVSSYIIKNDRLEDGTVRQFGFFAQKNYAIEDNEMKFVSGTRDLYLFTLEKDEKGAWVVTDSDHPEDGDQYRRSLRRLCQTMDTTMKDFDRASEGVEMWNLLNLSVYLEDHPEIERAEYNGEMMTLEEINELSTKTMEKFFTEESAK